MARFKVGDIIGYQSANGLTYKSEVVKVENDDWFEIRWIDKFFSHNTDTTREMQKYFHLIKAANPVVPVEASALAYGKALVAEAEAQKRYDAAVRDLATCRQTREDAYAHLVKVAKEGV